MANGYEINDLAKEEISDMRPNHQNDPKKQIRDIKNLKNVIEVIYQVRNNLFHGSKDVNEINDRAIVEFSGVVLYHILEKFLIEKGYL